MTDHHAVLVRALLFATSAAIVIGVTVFGASRALGHDVYTDWYDSGEIGVGRWCCSGNLEGTAGDCSPAQYTMNKDGSAFFTPKQYPGAHILVPRHRILWMTPPNRDPAKSRQLMQFDAHWCGKPRPAGVPPTEDDPDPGFVTICSAIAPGGV